MVIMECVRIMLNMLCANTSVIKITCKLVSANNKMTSPWLVGQFYDSYMSNGDRITRQNLSRKKNTRYLASVN